MKIIRPQFERLIEGKLSSAGWFSIVSKWRFSSWGRSEGYWEDDDRNSAMSLFPSPHWTALGWGDAA